MKKIIIVGAGGFGREVYYLIKDINRVQPTWELVGFLDDKIKSLYDKKIHTPILATIDAWKPAEDEYFILGIASPKAKEIVANKLKSKGAKFATLISPMATVNETVEIGEGCVVTGGSIGDCSKLGSFVNIAGSMIGQDVEIGHFSTITGYVNIPKGRIGKRVFVGSHAVILNDLEDDVEVVPGSVVFHRIKAGTKVIGYPAKKIEI